MQEVTPRINSALLPRFIGKTVRLDGRVIKLDQTELLVEASDGGQVVIKLNPGLPQITDTYVEVIGTVLDATIIRALHTSNLGSNIDLKVVDGLVDLTMKHPQIFGGA